MKTMIFAGVVALAMTAMAQGTAPAAAPTTQPTATETKAPAKKAMKAKKASKKPKAEVTAPAPAVVAAPAPAAVAPAAGTSTAAAPAAAAPAKKWGASINVNPAADFATPTELTTLTTFGLSYKVTDKIKLALKPTFETVAPQGVDRAEAGDEESDTARKLNDRSRVDSNNFRAAWTDLAVSSSTKGIMGSDEIALGAALRVMQRDALVSSTGTASGIKSHIELSANVPYTISPKFSAALFTQYRNLDVIGDDKMDRLVLQPGATYTINDVFSVYQAVGYMKQTQKGWRLEPRRERLLIETGVEIAPLKGLGINLNVNQDKALSTTVGNETVSGFNLYKPTEPSTGKIFDSVAYEANISYSF